MPLTMRPADATNHLLRDDVYQQLFDAILDGTLAPGENLRDDDLVDALKVSRAPIREALQQLREIGLVEMAPNRYTRVAPIDIDLVSKTLNTVVVLYEIAVFQAVPLLDEEDKIDLGGLLDDLRTAVADNDLSAFSVLLYEYFVRYAAAAGNAVLLASMERLTPHLRRSLTPRPGLLTPPEILPHVERIHRAALERDAAVAASAVHDMAAPARRYFLDHVRSVEE